MLSIILPIYNEEESLNRLFTEFEKVFLGFDFNYEVIAVNDGSKDKSLDILKEWTRKNNKIKVINFSRNFGQTAAMSAGIDYAHGDIIIPMDADLQNDPADIPKFLAKSKEGYDIVSGWRKNRQDKLISRKIPSWIANFIISKVTKVNLHDYGCTMKAYKKEMIKSVKLYGEMHRFIPAFAVWHGAKITEIEVNHRQRSFGKTKYGISRTFKVILDLLVVKFLTVYATKPMHFFGKIGFYAFLFATLSGVIAIYLKFFLSISFIVTPLPLLTALLVIIGVQFILMGLLAEILIRIYYEAQNKTTYTIKENINLND